MKDKIVLVTGATSGIGKVTVLELARMGASVIIAGRSEEKCQATLKTITEETGNTSVEYLVADLPVGPCVLLSLMVNLTFLSCGLSFN